jgi:uncharacterized 2Fe-2S/4Fe-4S cluster protein (DUF4445 family)
MPLITFQPSCKTIEVPPGTDLLEAARQAHVEIDAPCGGKGTCGKCLISVVSGVVTSRQQLRSLDDDDANGFVQACTTFAEDGAIVVTVPQQSGYLGGKFAEEFSDNPDEIPGFSIPSPADSMTRKICITVAQPDALHWATDIERLKTGIFQKIVKKEMHFPLKALQTLPQTIRAANGMVTVTICEEENTCDVIDLEAGDRSNRHFGIAVDVGTTTIALHLVDLSKGSIVATLTDYNGQIPCGLDVISRINYARRRGGLEELRNRVLETVNRLICKATESRKIELQELCEAVVSGNTTMTHLLLGIDPEYIRLGPYVPALLETALFPACEVGLRINPLAKIRFSPGVGSYVGGDITAGILCADLSKDVDEINLFLDIGTNGELVAGNNEFLMACACSAGPAFEGGGIEFGMRAAHGAVEKVEVDGRSGRPRYWTIGNVMPKGICGSGMISLVAELYFKGMIDSAGKLDWNNAPENLMIDGRQARYIVVPAREAAQGKAITVSDADIENIVRAKAAIYSACSLMLSHLEIGFGDLAHVYIAGGFGRFLDIEKAIAIGLLPDVAREKFVYLGNASLSGSYRLLVSGEQRRLQKELARRITYIDLSDDPRYMDHYTAALFLPHTDLNQFPSIKVRTKA